MSNWNCEFCRCRHTEFLGISSKECLFVTRPFFAKQIRIFWLVAFLRNLQSSPDWLLWSYVSEKWKVAIKTVRYYSNWVVWNFVFALIYLRSKTQNIMSYLVPFQQISESLQIWRNLDMRESMLRLPISQWLKMKKIGIANVLFGFQIIAFINFKGGNRLRGTLPVELGQLTDLDELYLCHQWLLKGIESPFLSRRGTYIFIV